MRYRLNPGPIAGVAALTVLSGSLAAAEVAGSEPVQGWYFGGSAGGSRGATLEQEGFNLDSVCYPDQACFDQNPIPVAPGYRWGYDLSLDTGPGFELFAGRHFGRMRVELALATERNSARQGFTGIGYYDGSPYAPRADSTVFSDSRTDVDNFNTLSLMLNAYYDFPRAWGRLSPYLGAGVGMTSLEVAGVHFSSDYQDPAGGSYEPPLSFYNSVQNADFREDRFRWAIYAGADWPLGGRVLLGVKLSYARASAFEDTGDYETHPMHDRIPGFTNTTRFSAPRQATLAITIKRHSGR